MTPFRIAPIAGLLLATHGLAGHCTSSADNPPPSCPDLALKAPSECIDAAKFSALTPLIFAKSQPDDCTVQRPGSIDPWLRHCEYRNNPPPDPQLNCSEGLGTATCEVYPQGSEIRYTWSYSGGISGIPMANTSVSTVSVNCLSPHYTGRVNVTLIGPNNLSSTASMLVSCPPQ
jgi:hypothetical protein